MFPATSLFKKRHLEGIIWRHKLQVSFDRHCNLLVSLIGAASIAIYMERWGAGVETQKNVRGEIGGWGRVPFNETYAPSLSTIYDGA